MHQRLLIWNFRSQLNFSEKFLKHKDEMQVQFIFFVEAHYCDQHFYRKRIQCPWSLKSEICTFRIQVHILTSSFLLKNCVPHTQLIFYTLAEGNLIAAKSSGVVEWIEWEATFLNGTAHHSHCSICRQQQFATSFLITHLSFLGDHWTSLYIFLYDAKSCDENHMSERDSLKMAGVDSKIRFNSF